MLERELVQRAADRRCEPRLGAAHDREPVGLLHDADAASLLAKFGLKGEAKPLLFRKET